MKLKGKAIIIDVPIEVYNKIKAKAFIENTSLRQVTAKIATEEIEKEFASSKEMQKVYEMIQHQPDNKK